MRDLIKACVHKCIDGEGIYWLSLCLRWNSQNIQSQRVLKSNMPNSISKDVLRDEECP